MRVQIICGFLGAGKTTLLKQLLRQHDSDTVVLVNEFGELGIDGAVIADDSSLDVVEMPSGCICCSLRESLVETVSQIMEKYDPRQLIIEPSGVASPSSILLGLKHAKFASQLDFAPVVGVMDLTFFPEAVSADTMGTFFEDQILNSDIILMNKADLVTSETVQEGQRLVAAINPTALIIPTTYCRTELPRVEAKGEIRHFHYSSGFNSVVFTLPGVIRRDRVEALLNLLDSKEFGDVFRAKGIFKTPEGPVNFDYVYGLINFRVLSDVDENKFVFIGTNIDRNKLEAAIR